MTKKVYLNEAGEQVSLGGDVSLIVALEFQFDDGSKERFELDQCDEATQRRLAWHGGSQKHGDSYASANAAADPLAYAKEAMKDTRAQLYAGEWKATSTGGPRISDLVVAVGMVNGQSAEENTKIIEAMTDIARKNLRKEKPVAAALAKIALDKAIKRAKDAEAAVEAEEAEKAAKAAA